MVSELTQTCHVGDCLANQWVWTQSSQLFTLTVTKFTRGRGLPTPEMWQRARFLTARDCNWTGLLAGTGSGPEVLSALE